MAIKTVWKNWLENMETKPGIPRHNPPRLPLRERWLEVLRFLFLVVGLVSPCAPSDPVRGIALPNSEPPKDACMVSAYYLSFYE